MGGSGFGHGFGVVFVDEELCFTDHNNQRTPIRFTQRFCKCGHCLSICCGKGDATLMELNNVRLERLHAEGRSVECQAASREKGGTCSKGLVHGEAPF